MKQIPPRHEVEALEKRIGKSCWRADGSGTSHLHLPVDIRCAVALRMTRRHDMTSSICVGPGEGHDREGLGAVESTRGRRCRVKSGAGLSLRTAPTRRRILLCLCSQSSSRCRDRSDGRSVDGGRSGSARGSFGGDACPGARGPDKELVVAQTFTARGRTFVAARPRPVAPQTAATTVVAGIVQEVGKAWLRRGSGGHRNRR